MTMQPYQPRPVVPYTPTSKPMAEDKQVAIWFAVVGSILIIGAVNGLSWFLNHDWTGWTQKCSDLYNDGYSADCRAPLPNLWGWCFGLSAAWCALMAWFLWRHRWYKRHPKAAAIVTGMAVAYGGYKLYEHQQQKQADRIGDAVADRIDLSGWDRG